jgi:hypothetical protein
VFGFWLASLICGEACYCLFFVVYLYSRSGYAHVQYTVELQWGRDEKGGRAGMEEV